ncbi:MAG: proton-conducting transporter membrane subunit [Myxococcota bacterium]
MTALWGLPAMVAVPLLGVGLVLALRQPRHWTGVAAFFAGASAAQALARAVGEDSGVSAALAVNSAIATVVLLGQPRRGLSQRDLLMPLVWVAASALVLESDDARLVALGWVAPPAVVFFTLRRLSEREGRARRVVAVYLMLGSLLLVAAVAVFAMAAANAGVAEPFRMSQWHAGLLSPGLAGLVFLLVAASVMARLGVPPLHSWLPTLSETLPAGTMLALTSVQMAVHVMVQLALVPLPLAVPQQALVVQGVGVAGVVYAAVMAASQHRLRRLIAYVVVAQSCALLVGLSTGELVSVSGALANAISVAITSRGLMLAAGTIEARVGPVDVRQFHGVSHPAPRLGAAALMLAFGAAGLPGSLGFVGEDLLLQGLVHQRPLVAGVLVGCTALVGIALLRAMLRTCFGPVQPWAATAPDLFPRERPLVLLAVAVVLLGVWPQPLVQAHQRDVAALQEAWTSRGPSDVFQPAAVGRAPPSCGESLPPLANPSSTTALSEEVLTCGSTSAPDAVWRPSSLPSAPESAPTGQHI